MVLQKLTAYLDGAPWKNGQKPGIWSTTSLDLNLDHVTNLLRKLNGLLSQFLLPSLQEAGNYGSIQED